MKTRLVRLYQDCFSALHQIRVYLHFLFHRRRKPRNLIETVEEPVIVSMTSHSGRLQACYWAVISLLAQDQSPTELHLWLQETDRDLVPHRLASLEKHGLTIHYLAEDYGPATKLLPSMVAWPDALIVTADDDAVYERSWLSGLLHAHRKHPSVIVCYRTHRIRYASTGFVAPYSSWEHMTLTDGLDDLHFFTGVGGVLYPPRSLHPEVLNVDLLRRLSIRNDDIWFNWMARKQGTGVLRVPGKPNRWTPVLGSRNAGLYQQNTEMHGNDEILRAIEKDQSRGYP